MKRCENCNRPVADEDEVLLCRACADDIDDYLTDMQSDELLDGNSYFNTDGERRE